MEIEFTNLLIVAAVAFAAPLRSGSSRPSGCRPSSSRSSPGSSLGPAVLGWVEIDEPVRVLAILGLAVLLFLAGLEIDYDRLRGRIAGSRGG